MKVQFKIRNLFLVLVLAIVGCSSSGKKSDGAAESLADEPVPTDAAVLKQFNTGIEQLDQENYAAAEKTFRNLVIENPTSQFHWVAMYNLAAAYEGLKKCQEAGVGYRKVARASMNKYPRLEAQALFRLSFAYSCLGFDEKAVASLLDAQRRSALLQEDVAVAEIPARLAAAYARLGNKEKANEYFGKASRGVQMLREKNKNRRAIRDILAKTLFLMGRMSPIEARVSADPFDYLTTLQLLQIYLLESVELNSDEWSPQSAQEIVKAYENIWEIVSKVKSIETTDPELKKKKMSELRFRAASEALANIKILKSSFRPDLKNNAHIDQLRPALDGQQRKLEMYLAENAVTTPLSDEAEKAQGLRRQGRTTEPLPIDNSKAKETLSK